MKQKVCFYQVFKTKVIRNGNCGICTPDEKNEQCEHYIPMTLWTVEVILCDGANTTKEK